MQQIGLMDANNFFVSCERLFRPDLVGKPVAVLSGNDGCIVARSNEVKAMGVPMGIPLFQAKQLVDFSQVTLFSSNFTLYRDISRRVMEVLRAEVGECEQYSIDESFFTLDTATTEADLAALRARVMNTTGIPVAIGLAATKTLAKAAASLGKKGFGVLILSPERWEAIASTYPTGDIWNLGKATATKLKAKDISTAAQFMSADRAWISRQFGVGGCRLYDELHGQVVHKVSCNSDVVRQSITSTRSFAQATSVLSEVESALAYHVAQVAQKLRVQKLLATHLQVVARPSRHSDFAFRCGSAAVVLEHPSNNTAYLLKHSLTALRHIHDPEVPYKKAGCVASSLIPESFVQPDLFATPPTNEQSPLTSLDAITDSLNRRFGAGAVRPAVIADSGSRTSALLRSKNYTTVWKDIPTVRA